MKVNSELMQFRRKTNEYYWGKFKAANCLEDRKASWYARYFYELAMVTVAIVAIVWIVGK